MLRSPLQYAQALGHEVADKRLDILRRIGEVGSISEAARGAGVSYKAAWQALETLSNLAGASLVEKAVGGSGGGGAQLTVAGKQLLEAAQLLHQARLGVLAKIDKRVDGALGLSGVAGLGLRTSMRNQFPCQIKSISYEPASARVVLALPNGISLTSKITHESAELLDLQSGMTVLALCKATAVVVGVEIDHRDTLNVFSGEISRLSGPFAGAEVSVMLMQDLHLVGFYAGTKELKLGEKVMVSVEESAIVIALSG